MLTRATPRRLPLCPSRIRYGIVSAAVIVPLMALDITLLGAPRVQRDGETVTFDTRKAMALLAHLALADRPRSRDALCALLWPAHDPGRARGALRRTLSGKAPASSWTSNAFARWRRTAQRRKA